MIQKPFAMVSSSSACTSFEWTQQPYPIITAPQANWRVWGVGVGVMRGGGVEGVAGEVEGL